MVIMPILINFKSNLLKLKYNNFFYSNQTKYELGTIQLQLVLNLSKRILLISKASLGWVSLKTLEGKQAEGELCIAQVSRPGKSGES